MDPAEVNLNRQKNIQDMMDQLMQQSTQRQAMGTETMNQGIGQLMETLRNKQRIEGEQAMNTERIASEKAINTANNIAAGQRNESQVAAQRFQTTGPSGDVPGIGRWTGQTFHYNNNSDKDMIETMMRTQAEYDNTRTASRNGQKLPEDELSQFNEAQILRRAYQNPTYSGLVTTATTPNGAIIPTGIMRQGEWERSPAGIAFRAGGGTAGSPASQAQMDEQYRRLSGGLRNDIVAPVIGSTMDPNLYSSDEITRQLRLQTETFSGGIATPEARATTTATGVQNVGSPGQNQNTAQSQRQTQENAVISALGGPVWNNMDANRRNTAVDIYNRVQLGGNSATGAIMSMLSLLRGDPQAMNELRTSQDPMAGALLGAVSEPDEMVARGIAGDVGELRKLFQLYGNSLIRAHGGR